MTTGVQRHKLIQQSRAGVRFVSKTISYRFHTVECSGLVEVCDDIACSDIYCRNSHYRFCVPLKDLSANPVRVRRVTRLFFICMLTAFATGIVGLCAIIDRQSFWFNLPGGMILVSVAALLVMMAIRNRTVQWALFTADSPYRTLGISCSGRYQSEFESFTETLADLIHHQVNANVGPNQAIHRSSDGSSDLHH